MAAIGVPRFMKIARRFRFELLSRDTDIRVQILPQGLVQLRREAIKATKSKPELNDLRLWNQ